MVVLDAPADQWKDSRVSELFSKLVRLRLEGYSSRHQSVLPLDSYDFVCTHLIFLDHSLPGSPAVMCYRFVNLSKCENLRMDWPAYSVAMSSKSNPHIEYIKSEVSFAKSHSLNVAYSGGWTMDPETRRDPQKARLLKELTMASHRWFSAREGLDFSILCGSLRLKTHIFLMQIGYQPVGFDSGSCLPSFRQYSLRDEPVIMLKLKEFSSEAEELVLKHKNIIDSRLEIIDLGDRVKKVA